MVDGSLSGHVKDDARAAEKQLTGRYEKPPPGPATCVAAMWQNVAEIFSELLALLAGDSEIETSQTIVGNSASDGVIEVPTEVPTILADDSKVGTDRDMAEVITKTLALLADDGDMKTGQAVIKNGEDFVSDNHCVLEIVIFILPNTR